MAAPAPRPAAARRSRSRDASRSRAPLASLPSLRQPPTLPCASSRAGGPGARLPPRRGAWPVSGLGGASQPLARARRAAVTWRRLGRDVTGRGAARRGCGPTSRVPIGRQVDVGRGDRADAGRGRSREVGRARLARLASGWRENLPRRLGHCNQAPCSGSRLKKKRKRKGVREGKERGREEGREERREREQATFS